MAVTKSHKEDAERATLAEGIGCAIAEADDFGFEVGVRALLESRLEDVRHGWSYVDPVEGKTRQFDLRGAIRHQIVAWTIRFAIECKNLDRGSPLVVSGVPRTQEEAFHEIISSKALGTIERYVPSEVRRSAFKNAAYPAGSFVGKSIVRLKSGGNGRILEKSSRDESEIFGRWTQALASSEGLAQGDEPRRMNTNASTVILPGVVVPDGVLWQVEYDVTTGKAGEPSAVDQTTIFVNNRICVQPTQPLKMRVSHIHFWTVSGLTRFLDRLVAEKAGHKAGTVLPAWEKWFEGSTEIPPHEVG